MSPSPHFRGSGGHVDPQTGLRTAAAFHRDLPAALGGARRSGRPLTLALVAAGLGTGTGAGRRVRRLGSALRRAPAFTYRLGHADFALLAPGTTSLQAVSILDDLVAGLARATGRSDPEIVAGVAVSDGWHAPEDLTAEAADVLRRTWAESA